MARARFLLLGLLALGCATAPRAPDLALADDADLAIAVAPVPDAANGYLRLREAAAAMRLAPPDRARLPMLLSGAEWDPVFAARLVAENENALVHLAAAVDAPSFQTPGPRDPDAEAPAWSALAGLSGVRAVLRAREGDPDGALADALVTARLGHALLADPHCQLWCAMLGVALQSRSYRTLALVLPELRPTPAESRALEHELARLTVDPAAWQRMWAVEYQRMKPSLAALGAADAGWLEDAARQTRAIRAWATRPCGDWLARARVEDGERASVLLLGNVGFDGFELRRCLVQSGNAAARAQVGLRAYQVEHGALPAQLGDLVPRYLDALPRDGFDGAPLRYDRAERTLRSVGSDLTLARPQAGASEDPMLADPSYAIRF